MTATARDASLVARRLGYHYTGLARSSTLVVPQAIAEFVGAQHIRLLIVPDLRHLRGRVPFEIVPLADIHDLSRHRTYERRPGSDR
ncbi:hypothetical protein [Nocardia nova]|uniref:hypothetical protein n=1 Tax=Nocardia nova TaxID=37330 RepID=UPI003410BD2C